MYLTLYIECWRKRINFIHRIKKAYLKKWHSSIDEWTNFFIAFFSLFLLNIVLLFKILVWGCMWLLVKVRVVILVLIGICVVLVRIVDDLWIICVHVDVLMMILCHISVSLMIAHVRMLFVEIFLMFCKLSCSDSKD